MPKVSALYHYPVKSCAGYPVNEITLDRRGPVGDREFVITDEEGVFLTQREHPKMSLITAYKKGDSVSWSMYLNAPSISKTCLVSSYDEARDPGRVKIWDDECVAYDQCNQVAKWLSDFLGVSCRLYRMADTFHRQVDPTYSPRGGEVGFADGFPLLLISDGSLADLNYRLSLQFKAPVTRNNFRSVLWVDDCTPDEEDTWKIIQIGKVIFDVVKPCARCNMTSVIPEKGQFRTDKEPLATLATYRTQELRGKKKVMFGQNLVHRSHGTISLGDRVEVLEYQ